MSVPERLGTGGLSTKGRRSAAVIGFFVGAVILQKLLYNFVRSKGVNITGDEPSYVMLSQALDHLTVHILPTIRHDLAAKVFPTTYPPNVTLAMVEHFTGPTGVVSKFPPGLSALLLPFVAVLRPVSGAVAGMICVNTAGLIWLHQRVSRLTRLGGMAQAVLACAFAIPAVLVAVNQIYPDLPAGILIAIGLLEVAVSEANKETSRLSFALVTVSVAVAPWLQPKNLVPVAIVLVAFLFVAAWRQGRVRPAGVVAAVSVVSFALFLFYNQRYYGHWLGLPEPFPRASRNGVEYSLGLLFDRDQGLFVQVPYCLLGLGGLVAFGRRRMPAATVATVLSLLLILGLNGTYVSNPYGGLSLAGRFMWTLIPISLPWLGLLLARFQELQKPLGVPLVIVVLAWIYQAEPIFTGHHHYYNGIIIAYRPWPAWWPGTIRVLPQFGRNRLYLGTPAWSLPLELIVEAAVLAAILYWLREPIGRRRAVAVP